MNWKRCEAMFNRLVLKFNFDGLREWLANVIAKLCFRGDLDRLNTIPSNRVVTWKYNFFNDLDCPNGALFSTIWVLISPAYMVSLCEPNITIFFFLNRQQKKLKRRFHHGNFSNTKRTNILSSMSRLAR